MASAEQNESERYRVIVLGRGGTEILLVPNGERQILPWVEIPRWQRVAENLTATAKSDWGEEVVCLFEPGTEPVTNRSVGCYQALEHLRACGDPKIPTRWVPLSTLCQDSLTDAQDYAVIKQVVTMCNKEIKGASAGPFARLGWFCELRNWIESVIEPMGLRTNGDFRQLNASPWFSLMRFVTNGPALWFKAVGEPNQREFVVTSTLARFFPDYLPEVLASRPDWNGWLSVEVQGNLLSEVQEQELWERTAVALARLQIQSIDRGSQVLSVGARDLGSAALSKLIHPFIDVVVQVTERQTRVLPPVLDREELLVVADSLQSALDATEATGIPETVGHLDLNPGNIIISENRTAFLDWAEAYVGNPLFSLQYLVEHAKRRFGADSAVGARLTDAYCRQWDGRVSSGAMKETLVLARLLAVFAYAVSSETWNTTEKLEESGTAGYLRSLVRRMHRESIALTHLWAPVS